ncbi:MAG: hypothetical protein IJ496_09450 [Ruminococcus sp.]|nr:hypothetical protein [Ruminococcus sp.]
MPRAKYDATNPYNLLFHVVGYFKVNYTDFLYDFRFIYKEILDFYGDDLNTCPNDIQKKLDTVCKANVKPSFKNRVYIVTDTCEPVFAAVNMDDAVFDNMVETFAFLEDMGASFIPDKMLLSYAITMYLFKGDSLCKIHSLSPRKLAEFMAVFKNENIVNYQGARDSWYGEPRRRAKKASQLLSDAEY